MMPFPRSGLTGRFGLANIVSSLAAAAVTAGCGGAPSEELRTAPPAAPVASATPPAAAPSVAASPAAAPSAAGPTAPGSITVSGQLKPELVEFPAGLLTLHGFLYRPPGPGPFPAIVFNHGSEPLPGWLPSEAPFWVGHGFVLFIPHRRGQGRSKDAGRSINTYRGDDPAFVDALVAQNDDVIGAISYLAAQPFVDKHRIAAIGCSLGGIESLLAAERAPGIVAAVDFAGASITWADNPALQDRMKLAARNARVPVFFVQAENDYNTAPSRVLSDEMKRAGKPMRVHIFPPKGTTPQSGHAFCIGGAHPPWGDEVLGFLAEAMPR
jgi:carboxymethylenebutenolidase